MTFTQAQATLNALISDDTIHEARRLAAAVVRNALAAMVAGEETLDWPYSGPGAFWLDLICPDDLPLERLQVRLQNEAAARRERRQRRRQAA